MAKRNYGKFTPARRAALKRAAYVSAKKRHARRKRNIRVGILAAGGVAALGIGAYLGHKHSATISAHADKARAAVDPLRKEAVRRASALGGNLIARGPRKTAPAVPGKGRAIKRPTMKRTVLDPVDPQKVRDKDTPYRAPGYHQKIDENTLEIIDRTDKYLSRELVKGRKVKDTTIRKALTKDAQAKGRSGVKAGESPATTLKGQNEIVNRMIADGSVRRTVAGRKIARGVDPKIAAKQASDQRKRAKNRRIKRAAKNPEAASEAKLKRITGFSSSEWDDFYKNAGI